MPGARVTETGDPVGITSSPGIRPVVDSYTWIVVKERDMLMTSPISFFFADGASSQHGKGSGVFHFYDRAID